MAKKHPNKHIRAAIQMAVDSGWRLIEAGGQAHIFGVLYCPAGDRGGCRRAVHSTPRNPENHAKQILRKVNRCQH